MGAVKYWQYEHPENQIAQEIHPFLYEKIHSGPTPGVTYGQSMELPPNPNAVKTIQHDNSMPLYLLGYINVPALGIYEPIHEGTSARVLAVGAGTVKPNQNLAKIGNYAIACHNLYDFPYGHDFGQMQAYDPTGKYAFVSDGKYIYTYKILRRDRVWYSDSIKYCLDDWNERQMSQLGLNQQGRYQVRTNSIADVNAGKSDPNGQYTYTRELTLYTCYEIPPHLLTAHYRIIGRGVQIEAQPADKAPEWKRALFPALFSDSKAIPPTQQKLTPFESHLRQDPSYLEHILNNALIILIVGVVIFGSTKLADYVLAHRKYADPTTTDDNDDDFWN